MKGTFPSFSFVFLAGSQAPPNDVGSNQMPQFLPAHTGLTPRPDKQRCLDLLKREQEPVDDLKSFHFSRSFPMDKLAARHEAQELEE